MIFPFLFKILALIFVSFDPNDNKINCYNVKIQKNKQKISSIKNENHESQDRLPEEVAMNRVQQRWTKDECALAVLGFRNFGQNFKVKLSNDLISP